MSKKITCVIPIHQPNKEHLQQAINSCVGFDEIIFHINGDTNLKDISLENKCPKTIIIQDGETIPCAVALNRAIWAASSEIIVPFTDDDQFIVENLQKALFFVRTTNSDIWHWPCLVNWQSIYGNNPTITTEGLREKNLIPFSCAFTKDAWLKVNSYQDKPFNDYIFWLSAKKKNLNFSYFDQPVYNFRQEQGTLSDIERKAQDFTQTHAEILQYIDSLQ